MHIKSAEKLQKKKREKGQEKGLKKEKNASPTVLAFSDPSNENNTVVKEISVTQMQKKGKGSIL